MNRNDPIPDEDEADFESGDPEQTNSVAPSLDDRSAMAKAMDVVTRITGASMAMVLPMVGGYFLDRWLNTSFLFVILGLLLGMVSGGYLLIQVVKSLEK